MYDFIKQTLLENKGFISLLSDLPKGAVSATGVAHGAVPFLLRAMREASGRDLFFICDTDHAAQAAFDVYPYPDKVLLSAPVVEFHTLDMMSADMAVRRAAAIGRIASGDFTAFLSTEALCYKLRPKGSLTKKTFSVGDSLTVGSFFSELVQMGYVRADMVESPAQMAGRGQIAEVWPADAAFPVRIVFAYDEIETIRFFDPDSQRSFGSQDSLTVGTATDLPLTAPERERLSRLLEKKGLSRQATELLETGVFPNLSGVSSLIENACTIDTYSDAPLYVFHDAAHLLKEYNERDDRRNKLLAAAIDEGSAIGCENDCFTPLSQLIDKVGSWSVDLPSLGTHKKFRTEVNFETRSSESMAPDMAHLAAALSTRTEQGWQTYIYAGGHSTAIEKALAENGISPALCDREPLQGSGVGITNAALKSGVEFSAEKRLFLADRDVVRVRRAAHKRKKTPKKDSFLADLSPGDVVVHEIHGKGRFLGLTTMDAGGVTAEYMVIEYRGGDKLYIKTDQIERIDKYIGPGDSDDMQLSKLGGKEWEAAKARARSSIKKMAEDLMAIYAERSAAKGYRYSPDTVWQAQFEDNFIYEESEGQLTAIAEIKRDMESEKIMDRLLMGDVGYGKTEVAMRACMKAAMDSKQSAVLVPTTLLARQHYASFRERFKGFPVKIGLLSRFAEKNKATLEGVKNGSVDIVIGTHKLLSKQVEFKDLGLLVIDEEQRFGVSHKERIKDRKRDVDVLTLSATPIPRTLEMAMTGIRDMSTIDTPPRDRKEVAAYVAEFDWGMVRDAILKEMARGGQAYFVARRIGQMDDLLLNLRRIVPEARVAVVHGQLSEAVFEKTVEDFLAGKYDVLLATTIIENGIDISSVNTLIVYEADKFGLSQLYQLKGRVGRGSVRAYVYFTHLGEESLSDDARKRLAAIKEFTRFGSGFKIAMRDLEIRGAGNVLGAEQSGHMSRIGYGLYCKLMREQVAKTMGRPVRLRVDASVELGANALIPESYVPDESRRMEEYRRIAAVRTPGDARQMREDLADRYGVLPQEVENLIGAALIKSAAEAAGISGVIRHGRTIELLFSKNAQLDVRKLMAKLSLWKEETTVRATDPPSILFKPKKKLLASALQLLHDIAMASVP